MQNSQKKQLMRLLLIALLIGITAFYIVQHFKQKEAELPVTIAEANGRIEAEQINISSKYFGKIKQLYAAEGDLVSKDQVVATLDTSDLDAMLLQAEAEVARAKQSELESRSAITQQQNHLNLAKIELDRAKHLVPSGAVSKREFDQRKMAFDNATAAKKGAIAHLHTLEKVTAGAQAQVALIENQLKDFTLRSPTNGRVLYRLAEPSEVVGAGSPVIIIVDLSEIYMEVFLSASKAARLAFDADARIKLDILPEYTIPAKVVFVSPEAQFTPKQVETKSDRENLMFRVKLKIPNELVQQHISRVKTGVRGDAYIQLSDDTIWPEWLSIRLPDAEQHTPQTNNLQR